VDPRRAQLDRINAHKKNRRASEDPDTKTKRRESSRAAYHKRQARLRATDPERRRDEQIRHTAVARRRREEKRQGIASTKPLVTDPLGSSIHDAAASVTQGDTQIASQHHEPVHGATDLLSLDSGDFNDTSLPHLTPEQADLT
jgi:hypothetical protein